MASKYRYDSQSSVGCQNEELHFAISVVAPIWDIMHAVKTNFNKDDN